MGSAKRLLEEIDEREWSDGAIEFTCPKCGKLTDDEIELPVVFGPEDECDFPVDIHCFSCKRDFAGSFEFRWGKGRIKLDDYPDTLVTAEPEEMINVEYHDDWYDWDELPSLPDSPLEEFEASYKELSTFASQHTNQLETRMLFMTAFGAFESYLADTFAKLALSSENNKLKFLKFKHNGKDIKFEISHLIDWSPRSVLNLLEAQIRNDVRSYSFHNLGSISRLYNLFLIDIYKDLETEKELLMKAIPIRHHCVHRNGKDENGKKIAELNMSYAVSVLKAMRALVRGVEIQITKLRKEDDDALPF